MKFERDTIERERAALRQKYGTLFETVAAILFMADPIGINFKSNTDEYEPEVETILPRLSRDNTVEEVTGIVYEEFVRWFGAEEAGSRQSYQPVAEKIWKAWQAFNQRSA
jgi:hypothetical protein